MNKVKEVIKFFGRLLIVLLFFISGINKIMGFESSLEYMQAYGIIYAAAFLLVVAIIIEIGASFLVMIGYQTKLGALLLLIYMIIITPIFHLNFADQMQFIQFFKNISIIGGLLYVMTEGPGYISVDQIKRTRRNNKDNKSSI